MSVEKKTDKIRDDIRNGIRNQSSGKPPVTDF